MRGVYMDLRQFKDVEELKHSTIEEWSKIEREVCYKLDRSMINRCASVLEHQSCKTKY